MAKSSTFPPEMEPIPPLVGWIVTVRSGSADDGYIPPSLMARPKTVETSFVWTGITGGNEPVGFPLVIRFTVTIEP